MMLLFLGVGNAWGEKLCQSSYTGTIGSLGSKTVYVSVGTIGTNMYRIVFESDFAMTGSQTYVNTSVNNNLCLDNATKTILDGGKIIYFDVPSTSAPNFKNNVMVKTSEGNYTLSGTAYGSIDWSQTTAECATLAGECTYTTNELILKVTTDGMTSTFELSHSSYAITTVNNVNPSNLHDGVTTNGNTTDFNTSGWTISDGKATKSVTWSTKPTDNTITAIHFYATAETVGGIGGDFSNVDISCAASGSGGGGSARTYDGEEKMYFLRDAWDWWKNDGAKFYAYFWNSSTSEKAWSEAASWVVHTTSGSKDVWAYTVPEGTWDKVIITRGSGASFSDGKTWDKSTDITLESTTNLLTDWTVDGQTGHSITWSNITLGSKTVYFDNRNVTDWTTAYVRIGHGKSNSAWGTMSKVAGTRNLYSQTTSQWDYHSDFTIANAAGWQNQNIYQPWENQNWASGASGLQMTKQTNYQKYGIDRDVYICPASTSVSERDCQYYKVNNSTSSNTIDGDNQRMALPQYTVTASGTNCTVELVEYTNDALTTSQAITANKVDPTRYVGVTVTPSTGYEFGSVSLTSSAYETHTATAAGVTGKYAIMADCEISATCTPITYNITYKDQDNVAFSGSHADGYPETHTYGTATILKTASKTGYTFGGWFTNSACTGSAVTSLGATAYTDDITLYAWWRGENYDVTLNHENGTSNSTVVATYGSDMPTTLKESETAVAIPSKSNYTFGGYYSAVGGGGTQYYTDAVASAREWNIADNTTLYAKWTQTITLNREGGTTGSESVTATYNSASLTITTPTKSGYIFGGYYTDEGGTGTQVINESGVLQGSVDGYTSVGGVWTSSSSRTLYANWTAKTSTINFDKNSGSSGSDGETGTYNSAMPSITAPTRTGYNFDGYYDSELDNNGTGTKYYNADGSSARNWDKEDASVTLYAKWTAKTYTITLDDGGATTSVVTAGANTNELSATYGSSTITSITTNPAESGYTFGGWWTGVGGKSGLEIISTSKTLNSSKSGYTDGDGKWIYDGDVTLYAKWTVNVSEPSGDCEGTGCKEALSGGNAFTNGYNYTITSDNSGNVNISVTFLDHQTGMGGELYMLNSSGGETSGAISMTWNNSTYTATHTLTDQSGTIYFKVRVPYSGGVYVTKMFTVDVGVDCTAGGGTTYTVTYNANRLDGVAAPVDPWSPYLEDASVTLLDYDREGYEFLGWNTAENGSGTSYASGATISKIDGNKNLYAQWRAVIDEDETDFGERTIKSTDDVRITNGATLTITEDTEVRDIIVETGSTLNVSIATGDKTLTVNSLSLKGGWNDDKSKYDMPRVYIDPASTLTKTNNTVNFDISVDYSNYYPFALPFDVALNSVDYARTAIADVSIYGTHYEIDEYNGQSRADNGGGSGNWTRVEPGATLKAGTGYILSALTVGGKAIIRFPMSFTNAWTTEGEQGTVSDVTKNVIEVKAYVKEEGETPKANKGWNLLGVPFMSCYTTNADMYTGDGTATMIEGRFDYETGKWTEKDANVYVTVPTHDFTEFIQSPVSEAVLLPGWCFFVQVEEDGNLKFLTTREAASSSLPIYAPQREQASMPTVKTGIILSSADASDKTTILVSDKYDGTEYEINADLEKMFGENSYTLATYSLMGETRLAYNAMSTTEARNIIPIGYRAPADGEYTFAINPRYADNFEHVNLIDYETGFVTDLLQSTYTFDTERTQNDERFALNIVPRAETPTDIEAVSDQNSAIRKMIIEDKMFIIVDGRMYDATGAMVK